ncbi:hypothetical protein [Ferrimonas sp. YFM]|uniref:hypothetical protein n=1 Tax=Ferrimonas sp. YFM TaxID=3028878 RepID=UPI0025733389|nr:hypothetical protein [Ferrimonas sp. YFM]BDY05140.1 hypothetical protein F0521_21810 [Ferrimonas sp. YFM]
MLEVSSLLVSAVLNLSPMEPPIDVDVVFIVEPQAVEELNQEYIRNRINEWVFWANQVEGVPYPKVKFQTKAVLQSNYGNLADVVYTAPIADMNAAAAAIQNGISEGADTEAWQAMQRFGADLVTYVVLEPDTQGNTSGSSGYSASILSLTDSTPDSWAHEAFRLAGLDTLAEEACTQKDNVMCPTQALRTAFPLKVNEQQIDYLHQVLFDHTLPQKQWFHITPTMAELAQAQLEVVQETLNEEMQGTVDFRVWLADGQGQEATLDTQVSVEIYVDSDSAEPGIHFDDDFTQRVDFLPGVSSRSVSLNIDLSGTQWLELAVGVRYGEKLGTNQAQSYNYDHNVVFLPVPEEKSTSGGSFDLLGLFFTLAALWWRRLLVSKRRA